MAKARKPEHDTEVTEIVSDATGDIAAEAPTPGDNSPEAPGNPRIVIDGVEYDAKNLSDPAKGAISSLQFAEARIAGLQSELAICQTARFAYVKGLKAELEDKAS